MLLLSLALLSDVVASGSGDAPFREQALRAGAALQAGRLEEAAVAIERLGPLAGTGDGEELRLLQAELAVEQGRTAQAGAAVADLVVDPSRQCRVDRIQGLDKADQGERDAAIDLLSGVVEHCAPDWRVWSTLGALFGARRDGEASRYAFEHALAAGAGRAAVRLDFALALLELDDPQAAIVQLRGAMTDPQMAARAGELLDFAQGMLGMAPARRGAESDEQWARRLMSAARGATQRGLEGLARSLRDQALIAAPRYDDEMLAAVINR